MESLEYFGLWWLPSEPENQIPGVMRFSHEDGICLEVLGSMGKILRSDINAHEIILGFTKDGKCLTLTQTTRTNFTLSCPGIDSEKYRASFAFLGVHFHEIKDITFFRVNVEYTYLSAWALSGKSELLREWENQELKLSDSNNSKLMLEANLAQCRILIEPCLHQATSFLEDKTRRYARMTVNLLDKSLSLDHFYFDYLYPLQNFLTLATDKNNFIIKATVFSRNGEKQSNGYTTSDEYPIEVISKIIEPYQNRNTGQMLFCLKDIEQELPLYIQKWLNLNDDMKHIINIYFGIKYNKEMYGEHRFISTVQALESYHRVKSADEQQYDPEHKKKLEEIYEKVPLQHIDWLKIKLNFSHEPTLKDRLKQLTSLHKKVINPFIKSEENFIKIVVNTRNYFTHYDISLKDKFARGDELFRLTQILSFLLQSCLLNELGCTTERCAELISRNNEYQYTLKVLKETTFKW